jgi:hypothetical protein
VVQEQSKLVSGKHKIVSNGSYDPLEICCGTKKVVMPKKKVYAARNVKDCTKFTTRIKDKTKHSSVFLPRHFCASLMVENDPKKEIEALRRMHRVAKEMDQAIHEFI